ncbi:transcriptional regulator with XRE-family HTH domain [Elusimicrobium posterum]|uniref:helix-turn-helix domain-containing protein n=1 Tax=Elusimicrobium posterum TaxID=3116653 RepID=UPI003C75C316
MSEKIKEIAQRLKELRNIEGISIEGLAKDLGISAELYATYESGNADIPLSVLYGTAAKFNVELTVLLTGEEPKLSVYSLAKKGEGINVNRRKEYDYMDLAYNFKHKQAEFFLVTVEPKDKDNESKGYAHHGHETMYITEGRIMLRIDGKDVVLEPGDFIYFDSKYQHAMIALDGKPAKFLATMFE